MKEVEFYALPRPVQDRLLEALSGRFEPTPVLHRLGAESKAARWVVVALGAGLLAGVLTVLGLGNASTALSIHPLPLVGLYALLLSAVAVGLLSALEIKSRIGDLPYQPGLYLFESALVDARDERLRIYPLDASTRVSPAAAGAVTLVFGAVRFTLPLADPNRQSEAVQRIEAARERLPGLDAKARFEIDPLEPPAVVSPLAPTEPLARKAPVWESQRWLVGILLGMALGAALFWLRNTASDNRMLAAAQHANDVAAYRAYLARGQRHRPLVAEVLLPRALLKEAVTRGSVADIDDFVAKNPKTGIGPEIDAARRNAMAAELERAKAENSLAALLSFAEAHPDHGLGPSFEQARHAAFLRTRDRYKKVMPEGAEDHLDFVGRLLAHAEKVGAKKTDAGHRGPAVEIRFRRLPSKTLARADAAIRKNPKFNGAPSYPSQYFDAKRLEVHEGALAERLIERFAKVFEPEALTFVRGEPIEGESEEPPPVTVPTLFITHRLEWSGGAIAVEKPRGVFIGILLFYNSAFVLPDNAATLKTKFTAGENMSHELVKKHADQPAAGALETAVYASLTASAFAQFESRLVAKWFKPE